MIRLEHKEDKTLVGIQKLDRSQENILADWVVALIRHVLNIPFKGDTYRNIFYVVNTEVFLEKYHHSLHMNLANNSFTLFFQLQMKKWLNII